MTVTGFEFAGIITAGIITAFAILLTMLAAEAIKARQIHDAITHLRWSGIMTFTSFTIMVSLFYKCEVVCWSARHAHTTETTSVAEQIASVPPTQRVCVTPSGLEITWEGDNDGVRSGTGTRRQRSSSIRRSIRDSGITSFRTHGMYEQSGATSQIGWKSGIASGPQETSGATVF